MAVSTTQLIFGCHSLATLSRKNKALGILAEAWELGLRSFDTAPLYSKGYSEILLGESICSAQDSLITSKFGSYPVPLTLLPLPIAMALNGIRRRSSPSFEAPQPRSQFPLADTSQQAYVVVKPIERQLHGSLRRLKSFGLDAYLLHELNPFHLPRILQENLINLQSKKLIKRIGYGGQFFDDLLCRPLPCFLSVLQFEFPLDQESRLQKLIDWLELNPHREVRLFGLFRSGVDRGQIARVTGLLGDHPNLRLLFSCRSAERLRLNMDLLMR